MARLLMGIVVLSMASCHLAAQIPADNFDFYLAITQQDSSLDWWNAVPSRYQPRVSTISSVYRGEFFKIINYFLFFHNLIIFMLIILFFMS